MTDADPQLPSDLDEALAEIDDRIVDGELLDADLLVERAIEQFGADEELLVMQAEVALDREDYRRCLKTVDEALEAIDDDEFRAELLELRGYALFDLDELDDARQAFNEAIKTGGASWTALMGRAMVHEEMDYLQAAMLDLDRMVAMDDQEPEPFTIRGMIRLREGERDKARGDLAHALSQDPDDEEARLNLARLQAIQQETSLAIETLEPLVEQGRDPDLVMPAALLRSQLSLNLGSTDSAADDAHTAIDAAEDQPWGYLQLAACRLTAMDPGEAIAAVKQAESTVDDRSEIPDAYALRASAYEKLGKLDKANEMKNAAEGSARLPEVVYGPWLNPARHVPVNPDRPVDVKILLEQLFGDPSLAPEGYEEALREVVDDIPERLEENPDAEKIRIDLPQIEGTDDAPQSLVLRVNRPHKSEANPGESED